MCGFPWKDKALSGNELLGAQSSLPGVWCLPSLFLSVPHSPSRGLKDGVLADDRSAGREAKLPKG